MPDATLTAKEDQLFLLESPQDGAVGDAVVLTMVVPYETTISSPASTVYLNGNDVTSTVLGGSDSASTNIYTPKTFTPDIAGRYVFTYKFTRAGGEGTVVKKLIYRCSKAEGG